MDRSGARLEGAAGKAILTDGSGQLVHALLTIIWSTSCACSCIRSLSEVASGDSAWVSS